MAVKKRTSGTASSVPAGLACGATVASVCTLIGAAATARLIDRQLLEWEHTGYAVIVILLLSSWLAAITAAENIKRMRLTICAASGIIYYVILLMSTALFFGGQYSAVGETALLVFCGSMLGVFSGYRRKNRRIRKKIHLPNR